MGQPSLVKHGIEEERSDIRAHVSAVGNCIYVFPTKTAINLISRKKFLVGTAQQKGIITAKGYLVPPTEIPDLRVIDIWWTMMKYFGPRQSDDLSTRGEKAVRIVRWALNRGLFPIWTNSDVVNDTDMQIQGMDILVRAKVRIQVKCDMKAGDRKGCTGNLYIQTEECNPFKIH